VKGWEDRTRKELDELGDGGQVVSMPLCESMPELVAGAKVTFLMKTGRVVRCHPDYDSNPTSGIVFEYSGNLSGDQSISCLSISGPGGISAWYSALKSWQLKQPQRSVPYAQTLISKPRHMGFWVTLIYTQGGNCCSRSWAAGRYPVCWS
jgi:hypothetical protein